MTESLEEALATLRQEISPSAADKTRLRARIMAPLGSLEQAPGDAAPPPQPSPTALPPLTRWAALKAAGTLGLAAGTVLLGAGMGIGVLLERGVANEPAPPVAALIETARAPTPERAEPAAPAPAVAEPAPVASSAASSERRPPLPPPRATRKARAPNPLNDELAVLRRVERALRNSDPALALALLAELDERFPESRLVEERQAAGHIANCRQGTPDAVAHARAFLREHPASVYRQRVQLACEGAAPSASKHLGAALKNAGSAGH